MSKRSPKNLVSRINFDWFRRLGRNTKLSITLALVLVVVGITSILFTRSNEPEIVASEEPEQIVEIETADLMDISVVLVEGTLEYRTDESGWDVASEELKIEPGMNLRTVGAISRAVIALEDGSEVRMDANSQIEITTMNTNRVIITHKNGYVYNRILRSDSRDYVVETENAQFQSVGTAFRTIATGDEEAVEVYQSSVEEVITDQTVQFGEKLVVEENNQEVNSKVEDLDINTLKENEFIQWNKERDLASELFRNSLGFLSDFDGPTVEITSPEPSSSVTVEGENDPSVVIVGKTEANARLTVQSKSVSGSDVQQVEVDNSGSFTTPELAASFGNSVFEFIATDRRGNETKLNVTFTFARQVTTQEQGIALTGDIMENEVLLEWGLIGLTTPDGVRVVYGTTENLIYPESDWIPVDFGNSLFIDPEDGGNSLSKGVVNYFRVCRYSASTDSCDIYSNAVPVTIPGDTTL